MLKKIINRNFNLKADDDYRQYQFEYNLERFEKFSLVTAFASIIFLFYNVLKMNIFNMLLSAVYIGISLIFYEKFKSQSNTSYTPEKPLFAFKFIFLYILIAGMLQMIMFWHDINTNGEYLSIIILINMLVLIPDLDFYIISLYLAFFLSVSGVIILKGEYFELNQKLIFDVTMYYLIGFFAAFFNSNRCYDLFEHGKQLKKANELLATLVVTDNLTSLHNRRAFEEKFDSLWRNCKRAEKPFSIIMIDVDNFKLYNDTFGHPAGDIALVTISQVMRKSLRRATDFLARYGGEEFVVLLPFTQKDNAIDIAEQIRRDIENEKIYHPASKVSEYITVSIGVSSVTPNDNYTRNSLLVSADEALYIAKSKGRNKIHYRDICEHLFQIKKSDNLNNGMKA